MRVIWRREASSTPGFAMKSLVVFCVCAAAQVAHAERAAHPDKLTRPPIRVLWINLADAGEPLDAIPERAMRRLAARGQVGHIPDSPPDAPSVLDVSTCWGSRDKLDLATRSHLPAGITMRLLSLALEDKLPQAQRKLRALLRRTPDHLGNPLGYDAVVALSDRAVHSGGTPLASRSPVLRRPGAGLIGLSTLRTLPTQPIDLPMVAALDSVAVIPQDSNPNALIESVAWGRAFCAVMSVKPAVRRD